jgi:hypothetical protein
MTRKSKVLKNCSIFSLASAVQITLRNNFFSNNKMIILFMCTLTKTRNETAKGIHRDKMALNEKKSSIDCEYMRRTLLRKSLSDLRHCSCAQLYEKEENLYRVFCSEKISQAPHNAGVYTKRFKKYLFSHFSLRLCMRKFFSL